MQFMLHRTLHPETAKFIKEAGGVCWKFNDKNAPPNCIRIVPVKLKADTPGLYSIEFISDCIDQGKLRSLKSYEQPVSTDSITQKRKRSITQSDITIIERKSKPVSHKTTDKTKPAASSKALLGTAPLGLEAYLDEPTKKEFKRRAEKKTNEYNLFNEGLGKCTRKKIIKTIKFECLEKLCCGSKRCL